VEEVYFRIHGRLIKWGIHNKKTDSKPEGISEENQEHTAEENGFQPGKPSITGGPPGERSHPIHKKKNHAKRNDSDRKKGSLLVTGGVNSLNEGEQVSAQRPPPKSPKMPIIFLEGKEGTKENN